MHATSACDTAARLTQVTRVESVERAGKRSGLYKLLDAPDSRQAAQLDTCTRVKPRRVVLWRHGLVQLLPAHHRLPLTCAAAPRTREH
jgi:hypothetical protein